MFGMVDRTVGGAGVQGSLAPKQNQTQGPPHPGAQPPPPGLHAGPLAAPTAGLVLVPGPGPGSGLGPPSAPVPGAGPDLREPSEWGRKLQPSHLEPGSGSGSASLLRRNKRQKAESMLRNDSLSSDQSESLRPPPPRPYKGKRGGGNKRQMSVSSSEEEGGSTPEYTSCEDVDIESVSERGERGRGIISIKFSLNYDHIIYECLFCCINACWPNRCLWLRFMSRSRFTSDIQFMIYNST